MTSVLYEQTDRIVTITINRPDAINAIDPDTHHALIEAWAPFRDDDSAWVAILTGAGEKAFSASADLKKTIPAAFGKGGDRRGHNDYGLGGITRGLEIWKPTIAAINGFCLAGGIEEALCCDLRVAVPHATFGLPEVRWAIMPGAGGTRRLPRAIPLAKAMEMILSAERPFSDQAVAGGRRRRGGWRRENRAYCIVDPHPGQSSAAILRRRPRGSQDASFRGSVQHPETGTDDWWEVAAARRSAKNGAGSNSISTVSSAWSTSRSRCTPCPASPCTSARSRGRGPSTP